MLRHPMPRPTKERGGNPIFEPDAPAVIMTITHTITNANNIAITNTITIIITCAPSRSSGNPMLGV